MNKPNALIYSAAIITAALSMQVAHADQEMAKSKGCMVCHKLDGKLIGPGYKEVAKKYKDDEDTIEYLAQKIKNGGGGVWGKIPMVPNKVSDEQAVTLAKWILSL